MEFQGFPFSPGPGVRKMGFLEAFVQKNNGEVHCLFFLIHTYPRLAIFEHGLCVTTSHLSGRVNPLHLGPPAPPWAARRPPADRRGGRPAVQGGARHQPRGVQHHHPGRPLRHRHRPAPRRLPRRAHGPPLPPEPLGVPAGACRGRRGWGGGRGCGSVGGGLGGLELEATLLIWKLYLTEKLEPHFNIV